jgi:hypothetical protein
MTTDTYMLTLGMALPSHRLQKAIMPRESCPYSRVRHIGNGEFVACLSHNGADGRIMPMANARKQVVFNLKIQPPKVPGNPGVMRSKIGRSLYFMSGPCLWHYTGVRIRCGKAGVLAGMRELERDR